MNCKNCGSTLLQNDKFCQNCGAPVEQVNNSVEINNVPTPNPPVAPTFNNMEFNSNPNTPQQKKNNNNIIFIIITMLLVAIIAGLIVFIVMNKDDSKKDTNSNKQTVEQTDNDTNTNNTQTNNNDNNTTTTNDNTMTLGNYTFTLPAGFTYSSVSSYVIIKNQTNDIGIVFEVISGSYSTYVGSVEQLKTQLTSLGYTVNSYTTKTVAGVNYLLFNCTNQGIQTTVYFGQLGSYNLVNGYIILQNTATTDQALTYISQIVNSAKSTGNTDNNTTSSLNVDLPKNVDIFSK